VRHRVARLAELPERVGWLVEIEGREVALFRLGDRVHALDSECPHRGAALAFGEVRGEEVRCPAHAWPFHIPTGTCPEFPGVAVACHRVVVDGDEVFVEL
jgi:nitrite reductase/ring-hydroxylating ferredoxin subunit